MNKPLRIETNDGAELDLTPENSALFTHIGDAALYDHVFVATGETDGTLSGMYIFRHADAFKAIRKHMVKQRYPLHLNQTEVADCDRDAFERSLVLNTRDIAESDSFPPEWA